MLEGTDPKNAGINAWITRETSWGMREIHRPSGLSSRALSHDGRPVAVIAEFIRGNTAEVRISAHNASGAVKMAQTFAVTAAEIYGKLARMEELADRAVNSLCSNQEKAEMQEEFEQLAGEVNSLAANTQYDRNYLFTTAGETRTVSLDNEFYIHLFPKNLSFEADGLDLTTEPEVALSKTKTAAKLAGEYSQYLTGQLKYLEDAMARQDRELDTTDIDSDGFTTAIAAETVSRITKQIEKNGEPFRQIQQANIIAERAAYLLRVP